MEIYTERLRLRPWVDADLEALHQLWSDPQTIWWGAHTRLEQTKELMKKIATEGGWWAVEHEGKIVGNVFLRPSRSDGLTLELGYHIRSDSWGKGFATESARAVMAMSNGNRVEAPIVPENMKSQRVIRKL